MNDETAGTEATPGMTFRGTLGWMATVFGPFLGLVMICGLFAWQTRASGEFLSAGNWRTLAVQTVTVGIAALGMTLIMIAGGIDLSIGSVVALVTVGVAVLVRDYHLPISLALAAGVILGGLCGLFNGALITGLGVVPFIVTLGSLKIFRGAAKWLSEGAPVYLADPVTGKTIPRPAWLDQVLTTGSPEPGWLVVAPGVWVLAGLALAMVLMLRFSVLGRYLYAVGSSEPTARLCGINVPGVKLLAYGLAGLCMGLAGVMQFLELSANGDPGAAEGLELQVIAAVVIGGGSLSGGEGTVLGTLIGCLIIAVLNNGSVHAGFGPATKDVIIGAIIVAAVALDRLRRRRIS